MERVTEQFIGSEPFIPFDSTLVDAGRGGRDGGREERFTRFSEALGRELAPRSVLEQVLADHVILSAWTLRMIAENEIDAIMSPTGLGAAQDHGDSQDDASPQYVLDIADWLGKALELFHRVQAVAVAPAPASPPADPATDVTSAVDFEPDFDSGPDSVTVFDFDSELDGNQMADLSNEWPIVPRGRSVEDHPDGETGDGNRDGDEGDESLAERWRGRLFIDPSVSEDSPVIKGTWVTVSQVISLIVDGWTWSDILRTHPELSEEDIRTCLAYTVAEEGGDL